MSDPNMISWFHTMYEDATSEFTLDIVKLSSDLFRDCVVDAVDGAQL